MYNFVVACRAEDAAKALEASQGKRFFGASIVVSQHEGLGKYVVYTLLLQTFRGKFKDGFAYLFILLQ